jgi:hypothetical protein
VRAMRNRAAVCARILTKSRQSVEQFERKEEFGFVRLVRVMKFGSDIRQLFENRQ